jgi:hypothetical protein
MHNLRTLSRSGVGLVFVFCFLVPLYFLLFVGCFGEERVFVIVVCFGKDYAPWG